MPGGVCAVRSPPAAARGARQVSRTAEPAAAWSRVAASTGKAGTFLLPKSYLDFAPQLARRLQAPIPHGLLIGWEGLRCPGSPCPQVPSGPRAFAPCAALSWMAVRAPSRACSPSREGPAGEQSMVTDGTPSGVENCWGACPVGLERGCSWHAGHPSGCGGLWKTWECVVFVSPRARLPWAPSPGQENTGTTARTTPASLGRPRGLYSSSAPIFRVALHHPVCQTGCLPVPSERDKK